MTYRLNCDFSAVLDLVSSASGRVVRQVDAIAPERPVAEHLKLDGLIRPVRRSLRQPQP
jgi:hypothetical protein